MKLTRLFTLNLFFAIFFGVTCSLFPQWVFQLYGLGAGDAAIWTARLVGGSILGLATLMWFGRRAASRDVRRAIALALLIQDAIGFLASLEIQLTGKTNAFGWLSLGLYSFLVFAYAFFLFLRPEDS
jgi:hypothetical protein